MLSQTCQAEPVQSFHLWFRKATDLHFLLHHCRRVAGWMEVTVIQLNKAPQSLSLLEVIGPHMQALV